MCIFLYKQWFANNSTRVTFINQSIVRETHSIVKANPSGQIGNLERGEGVIIRRATFPRPCTFLSSKGGPLSLGVSIQQLGLLLFCPPRADADRVV